MSIQYGAYQVTEFFIEKIQEKGLEAIDILFSARLDDYIYGGTEDDIKQLWTEAETIDHNESMTIDVNGKWMENLHLLLSGNGGWQVPTFTISNNLNDREFLLINALTGIHKLDTYRTDYLQVSYLCPSEVKEVAANLPKIMDEDLESRWSYCESISVVSTGWDIDEVKEFLEQELIPFFKRASKADAGIAVVLS